MATQSGARRRIVASAFVTLDGYMVGPDEDMSWVAVGFDPVMQAEIAETMSADTDAFIFGRVTYEEVFAAYWPTAVPYAPGDALKPAEGKEDPRIIHALNKSPKTVFSRTLATARVAQYARDPRGTGGRGPQAQDAPGKSHRRPGQRQHRAGPRTGEADR